VKTNPTSPIIDVSNLEAAYGKGAKKTLALRGISFQVRPGECVGFIGANGAGKSTTLKILMGFRFPDAGEAKVFGQPAGRPESRARIGYLPEVALYYPFMKARELLELYGGLGGLGKSGLRERIPGILERVGLAGRGEDLLKTFSKGMQQRLGIAQSLITEPELLIYDELSSGLDPLGRYDLRELLKELKAKGTTLFFSSHELGEVESLCDRVVMIHQGRILRDAPLADLLEECGDRSLEAFYIQTLRTEAEAP
jgi:ABC-2 type transport system ATP-binding protein